MPRSASSSSMTITSAAAGQCASRGFYRADGDRELLIAAAVLHDIGYSALLIDTGFIPSMGRTI
jgi:predicted HD phosphohydrolase